MSLYTATIAVLALAVAAIALLIWALTVCAAAANEAAMIPDRPSEADAAITPMTAEVIAAKVEQIVGAVAFERNISRSEARAIIDPYLP